MPSEIAGFRLSPQQRQLWSSDPEPRKTCVQSVVTVPADLDLSALQRALNSLVSQQEILRTTFVSQAGARVPLQIIHDFLEAAWRQEDLHELSAEAQPARLQSVIEDERRPFDLERGPLVRACLLTLGAQPQVLVLTLSALCADSRTPAILLQDLRQKYALESSASEPKEAPLQYADYSAWQNELREAEDADGLLGRAFWEQGKGSWLPLNLPLMRRPEDVASVDIRCVTVTLGSEDSAHIDALGRRYNAGPGTILLACWQTLLFRLSRQETFWLGYEQDGRHYPELSAAYGSFAKMLPMPCRLSADLSFAQLLIPVAETQAQSERWQDYAPEPPEDSAPDLGIAFEQDSTTPRLEKEDTLFVPLHSYYGALSYRLKLTCTSEDSGWHLSLRYDARRFDADNAERMADYLVILIASVIADPETPLDALNLLPVTMRRQLLDTWNATDADYPRACCVHTLFEEQVMRTPHAVAVVGVDGSSTYQELNAAANRLAHRLRSSGVGRETRVGLLMERTSAMIVGVLGILKAGGAYVPLAPDAPKLRLAHQLRQTEAPVVVTQMSLRGLLSDYGGSCICLDSDARELAEAPDSNPEPINASGDLVYVIYTSGSTGQPKGVENTHHGLVNYTTFLCGLLASSGPIMGLQFASVSALSADLGNTSLFPCLLGGGTLHILSYEISMNATQFAAYSARHAVDVLKITPSHLNALLASAGGAGVLPRRCLFLGGEASSWELITRIRQAGTCRVINHYGPTETTIGSLVYPIPEEFPFTTTVPIGRPIANTRIYLLDPRLLPVPVGVSGELYIGGDGLARGYIGQQELTDSRFVPDPFAADGSRLYRTGDVARYLADGSVEFLGRIDDQVKIRGFRVEPGEIEAALRTHAGVHQTVVVSQEDGFGEKRLVGYYVGSAHGSPTAEDLKAYLQDILPDYMIPHPIVRLMSLPLAPNGKVDRAALPVPEQVTPDSAQKRILPRTPVEMQMASIWQEVMGGGEIGVDDDFFELGGHSLMAIQVMSRVRETFRIDIPLNALFEASTIASLTQIVVTEQEAAAASDLDLLFESLENLSEEEAEALLAQER